MQASFDGVSNKVLRSLFHKYVKCCFSQLSQPNARLLVAQQKACPCHRPITPGPCSEVWGHGSRFGKHPLLGCAFGFPASFSEAAQLFWLMLFQNFSPMQTKRLVFKPHV